MKSVQCRFCKEEIKSEAMICKHCHQRLDWSREELVMAAISERIQMAVNTSFTIPEVTACGAHCHASSHGNKIKLNECLDMCKAIEATAVIAERLHRELFITFADIVWGGGDIDPIPFEKTVRERFSRRDLP